MVGKAGALWENPHRHTDRTWNQTQDLLAVKQQCQTLSHHAAPHRDVSAGCIFQQMHFQGVFGVAEPGAMLLGVTGP